MDYSKYLGAAGLTELWNLMTAYIDKKIFIGTQEEYEAIAHTIPLGAIVVIVDKSDVVIPPEEDEAPEEVVSSAAILGTALLGSMLLGQS